jgi:hypothetical protein
MNSSLASTTTVLSNETFPAMILIKQYTPLDYTFWGLACLYFILVVFPIVQVRRKRKKKKKKKNCTVDRFFSLDFSRFHPVDSFTYFKSSSIDDVDHAKALSDAAVVG